MNNFDLFFQQQPDEHPTNREMTERVTANVLAAITVVATIYVSHGQNKKIFWGLIGVTVLAVLWGPIRWLVSVLKRVWSRFQDWRAARRYFTVLLKQTCQFRKFVTSASPTTLHFIAESGLCQGHGQRIATLGMPNVAAWKGRADLDCLTMSQRRTSRRALFHAALEFHDMVGTYINLCVECAFGRLPRELRESMTPEVRSALNSFQQEFHTFQYESEQLLQQIAMSRPYFARLPWQFTLVKPLG